MFTLRKSCYCAFCKIQRKVYVHRHLVLVEVIGLVLLGILMTQVLYQSLDLRGLLIVATLLVVAEIWTQMRWRASMICRNCGFDPVVYMRSPEEAGLKIKAFLEKRSQSADYLLRPSIPRPQPASGLPPKASLKKEQNLSLKM